MIAALTSFSPRETGDYSVNIYCDEKHIKGSPVKIPVGANDVGKAAKVKVKGATNKANANSPNTLVIDTSAAGTRKRNK